MIKALKFFDNVYFIYKLLKFSIIQEFVKLREINYRSIIIVNNNKKKKE